MRYTRYNYKKNKKNTGLLKTVLSFLTMSVFVVIVGVMLANIIIHFLPLNDADKSKASSSNVEQGKDTVSEVVSNNAESNQGAENAVQGNINTSFMAIQCGYFANEGYAKEAYNKVAPAAVVVSTKSVTQGYFMHTQEVEGIGSGFIINEEGYILTNYHVIQGAQEISVTLSNDVTTTAQVVNYDENQDVAMIKITDESVEIPATVELGDSDALQPGEEVIAIGTPLSTELSSTVTKGIISATSRSVAVESGVTMNLIQTDAAINAGNSGGPLVNTKGEVVGINSSKISGEAVEGIGFSIPINDIKDKIESLSKPILNLGISVRTIDESLSKQLNMEQGLYIVEVTEFSSAEKAGLKAGDIIVKADGTRITTFDEFKEIKNAKEEGDDISLEVVRNGESKTINVTLTAS